MISTEHYVIMLELFDITGILFIEEICRLIDTEINIFTNFALSKTFYVTFSYTIYLERTLNQELLLIPLFSLTLNELVSDKDVLLQYSYR